MVNGRRIDDKIVSQSTLKVAKNTLESMKVRDMWVMHKKADLVHNTQYQDE